VFYHRGQASGHSPCTVYRGSEDGRRNRSSRTRVAGTGPEPRSQTTHRIEQTDKRSLTGTPVAGERSQSPPLGGEMSPHSGTDWSLDKYVSKRRPVTASNRHRSAVPLWNRIGEAVTDPERDRLVDIVERNRDHQHLLVGVGYRHCL
jgi:hypothetical protein